MDLHRPGISRQSHRRLTAVAADPDIATIDDLDLLLAAHAVGEHRAGEALDRALCMRLDPPLLWAWVMAFDGHELAALLCSELADDLLVAVLEDGLELHRALIES